MKSGHVHSVQTVSKFYFDFIQMLLAVNGLLWGCLKNLFCLICKHSIIYLVKSIKGKSGSANILF